MNVQSLPTRDWTCNALAPVAELTFDQQLKAAGLDWQVKLSSVQYGEVDESGKPEHMTNKAQAAYRSDNGAFLDIYTRRIPWQNQDILGQFWEFCKGTDLKIDYLGYLRGEIVAMAKIDVTGLSGDPTENWLVLNDSHKNGQIGRAHV